MEDLSLVLLGDLMLGRIVDQALTKQGLRHVWGNFVPLLSGGHGSKYQIVSGNLECAITDKEEKFEKEYNFKLSPVNARVLKMGSLDYVSLANNHTLDYLEVGLDDTKNALEDVEVHYSGAGTKEEAMKPAIIKRDDTVFAFYSFADHYPEWAATDDKKGINYIDPENYDIEEFKTSLSNLRAEKKIIDIVIVFMHWGPNWSWHPGVKLCDLAHDLIDAGADIIFGHSAHHIQGVEIYKGYPIIYGAGSFIDDYAIDKQYRNDLSFLYNIKIQRRRLKTLELYPSKVTHVALEPSQDPPYLSKVMRAENEDLEWVCSKMKQLCKFFGTDVLDMTDNKGIYIPLGPKFAPRKGPPKKWLNQ